MLWRRMPLALALEAVIALAGLALFLAGARLSRARALGLAVVSLLVVAFTVVGMTVAPPPPSAATMAASSLATIIGLCALVAWLCRRAPSSSAPALRAEDG